MFSLPSVSESIPSTMPPPSSNEHETHTIEEEEEEEVRSGHIEGEKEVSSGDEIGTNDNGEEARETIGVTVEQPKVGMMFDTPDEAFLYYSRYAKQNGFGVARKGRKMGKDGALSHVTFECSRGGKARVRTTNPIKPRPQTKIECPARLSFCVDPEGQCRLSRVTLEHNHAYSPGKSKFYKSNRELHKYVKRKLILNDNSGIKLHKTYDSLQIQAGGHENLPYSEKDCRNYVEAWRRSLVKGGDAEAMHNYFMKMKADNSDFFFAMDLDDEGRLRNVFWADARSRAACKEFGDAVTFDTTYLVNKYDMPFAPFVGVNHHGQSILLGCGLISQEDTKTFSWIFKTWMTCMWGCAPKAIITDQCMAMKNAIEEVFPNTRHRWCIWHILKKVPQKLGSCEKYRSISWCLHNAIYDSLSKEDFEKNWEFFIEKYKLENNEWLSLLYLERNRWVPAFVKDSFWAGMSSTQRSESMNAYFDGYVNTKTTLKQFVEQYGNALAKKMENEKNEDMKSSQSYIPSIVEDDLEEQFHSAYTNAKAKEFQEQFVGKLKCKSNLKKVGDVWSEYEVKEKVTFGEGEERRKKIVSFTVDLNVETNEANCNCRLFEFKGMVCKHQLLVWHNLEVEKVPDKYVLERWRKDVKRCHTKIQINYDHSSNTIEARRHDNMCKLFNEVADLTEDCQEKYDKVMGFLRDLKEELIKTPVVGGCNVVFDSPADTFSLGDEVVPFKESMNILDPVHVRRKGRPRKNRLLGPVEKIGKKKKEQKKESNEKEKGVEDITDYHVLGTHDSVEKIGKKKKREKKKSNKKDKGVEDIVDCNVLGTQESVVNISSYPSYTGQLMWPNLMPHNMPPISAAQGGIGFMPSSQSFMPNVLASQVWGGQSSIMGSQVWGGPQPSVMESPWQGWRRGQVVSFTDMMTAADDAEE